MKKLLTKVLGVVLSLSLLLGMGVSALAENYSKYNMRNVVRPGDILYEAAAGYGITGHIAIVEGVFTDSNGKKYVSVIEAIDRGVVRKTVDDDRIDKKDGCFFRVKNCSEAQAQLAVEFCIKQLGKPYKLDFRHDKSVNEKNWYCSELVWAAYKSVGFDIETGHWYNEPGITPRDIARCGNTKKLNIKK